MDLLTTSLKLWRKGRLPLLNGLLLGDGRCFAVKHNVPYSAVLNITPQDIIIDPDQDYSAIDIMAETVYNDNHIYCGEGSFGGDGFVIELSDINKIAWLFIHDNANPFVSMQILNGVLYIQNNCQITWRFNLANPLDMAVDLTTGINY